MKDLDTLLREDAGTPLADAGFALRVATALPPRAPRVSPLLRYGLVMAAAVVGSLLAAWLAPSGSASLVGFTDILSARGLTGPATAWIAISVALLFSAVVVAADSD